MTDEVQNRAAIEELKTSVPAVVVRTRRAQVLDAVRNICALVALIAIGVALYSNHRASSVGACVNQNLGIRNQPSSSDAQAHIDFANSLDRIFSADPATQKKLAPAFKAGIKTYADTLATDQAERNAYPLGQC